MRDYVFYVTNKQKHVGLAVQSAASVKKHCTLKIQTVLFFVGSLGGDKHGFDICVNIPVIPDCSWWRQQTLAMPQVIDHFKPTDRLLYMDCDTYAIGDVAPLFALLEVADIAGAHSPRRYNNQPDQGNMPRSFAEYNIGVNIMRASENVRKLWDKAAIFFDAVGDDSGYDDQIALHEALWWMLNENPRFRCAVFPSEWNCRFNFPGSAGKDVIVLHGAADDMEAAVKKVNSTPNSIRSW